MPAEHGPFDFGDLREIREIILAWGEDHFQEFPWRDPDRLWHGLAAEILLQRTRAQNVVPVYLEFIQQFSEPEDLGHATEEEVLSVIGSLGLHWRAPLLKELGQSLSERGNIPDTLEELKQLPGVGQYVASAWLTFHGNQRALLIDANIVRWLCRMLGHEYDGETRREKWVREILDRITPEEKHRQFNYALLDFTMSVCQSLTPLCEDCPIGPEFCEYGREELSGKVTED